MKYFINWWLGLVQAFWIIFAVAVAVEVLMVVAMLCNLLQPAATILFVLVFTVLTFGKWFTATLSILGIVLYAASWLLVNQSNPFLAMVICCAGILAWFTALALTFGPRLLGHMSKLMCP